MERWWPAVPADADTVARPPRRALLHGTTIALGDLGATIIGPSGAGKSDLALRCLALSTNPLVGGPVDLVSDDQTLVSIVDGRLVATAPDTIRGMIEVRGVGILPVPARSDATLALIVDLMGESPERLPPIPQQTTDILGLSVPRIRLDPFEGSAPLKLLLALRQAAPIRRGSP